MDVAHRPRRISEILLADEHERSLGHGPSIHGFLVGDDLVVTAAEMDRAGVEPREPSGTPSSIAKSTVSAPGP